MALAACAERNDVAEAPRSTRLRAEGVVFGGQLAQIRGHHLVATALHEDGDESGAAVHTGHPVAELLAAVRAETAEHDRDVADRLEPTLAAPSKVVAGGGSTAELTAAVAQAARVVAEAEEAVLGPTRTTVKYRASVIAALLSTAAHEYEEAVGGGSVKELVEYQDAYAFTAIAKQRYEAIADRVHEAGAHQADEIDEDFGALKTALPSHEPPRSVTDPKIVRRHATHVGSELEETVDAVLLEEVSSAQAFANINRLLDEIVARYRAGDREQAAELVAEAYLENYEHIEADVIEHARAVNAELEPLLGAQLRAKIRSRVAQAELEQMVENIRRLLKDAQDALEGHR